MTTRAYLALGSNLGDRQDYLDRALQALQEQPGIVVTQVSSYYETEPVGGPPGQGKYVNAAAEIETEQEPGALLRTLLDVERTLGRVRTETDGPRTIDLDLLLYGDLVRNEPGLTVPHPRLHERLFVLQPLAQIAADVVHPVLGQTVLELLERLPGESEQVDSVNSSMEKAHPRGADMPRSPGLGRELAGLRAVVTGSTSGIGRAIALELASAGADVAVHGRRSRSAVEETAAELGRLGVRSLPLLGDLREADACSRLVQAVWDAWGGADIWINNAGVDTLTGEAGGWPFERKLLELLLVDVTATILLGRDVGRRMQAAGSGVLLNLGWDQAETGMEGDSGQLFGAAKAAVMAFTKSLALTLAPEVRVNCLAPGWIQTAWGTSASAAWQERVQRETPLRRWGTPADVAAAARWLVSPAAAFVTGQVIRVNGGSVR